MSDGSGFKVPIFFPVDQKESLSVDNFNIELKELDEMNIFKKPLRKE